MTYQEMLEKLDSLGRFGMKLTLDRVKMLLAALGHPEERLAAVHVAGTNGKGSTVAMLDSILRAAGYRTGRWTSPHLVDFAERLALDGQPAPHGLLASAFTRVWPLVEEIKDQPGGHPTQFEVATAMAFLVLAETNPDLSLIEVGLGGRHDSTNVFTPLVSVITHLALDHTDRLGPDLASIAREKAGIIKPGRPVIAAPQEPEALAVIEREAASAQAPLTLVGRDMIYNLLETSAAGTFCCLRGKRDYGRVRINLLGAHQAANAATAVAAAESLLDRGFAIPIEAVQAGLDRAVWPGRLEIMSRKPLIVLDGAHNPDGLGVLVRALREVFRRERVDFLLGFLENRPVEEMAGILAPMARRAVITGVPGGTAPAADMSRITKAFAGSGAILQTEPDPAQALALALRDLPDDGLLCVCGSLAMVGRMRGIIISS